MSQTETSPDRAEKRGGHRANAGRKVRMNIHFSNKEKARNLFLLMKHRRAALGRPDLTEEDVVNELVDRAWETIEKDYEEATELAKEGDAFIL